MKDYHAYLIRFWREEEQLPWRVTLVLPQTGERVSFASIEQAFSFLTDALAGSREPPREPGFHAGPDV